MHLRLNLGDLELLFTQYHEFSGANQMKINGFGHKQKKIAAQDSTAPSKRTKIKNFFSKGRSNNSKPDEKKSERHNTNRHSVFAEANIKRQTSFKKIPSPLITSPISKQREKRLDIHDTKIFSETNEVMIKFLKEYQIALVNGEEPSPELNNKFKSIQIFIKSQKKSIGESFGQDRQEKTAQGVRSSKFAKDVNNYVKKLDDEVNLTERMKNLSSPNKPDIEPKDLTLDEKLDDFMLDEEQDGLTLDEKLNDLMLESDSKLFF